MTVTIVYTTQLKAAIGLAQEHLELPEPATLGDVFAELRRRHPNAIARYALSDDGAMMPSLVVCLEDRQIPAAMATTIPAGATLTLLSAISGG